MKSLLWTRHPERLGCESGIILALGSNKKEEIMCVIFKSDYTYDAHVYYGKKNSIDECNDDLEIYGRGSKEIIFIDHDYEELCRYEKKLSRRFQNNEISVYEFDELFLKKLCKVVQDEISSR